MTIRITDYAGIDYRAGARMKDGRLVNQDDETLVHYGVLGVNDCALDWDCDTESVYEPHCPSCGTSLKDLWIASYDWEDGVCPSCGMELGMELGDDDVWGEEPDAVILTGDYEGFVDSHNDVMITKSPYYTLAQFCSPCVPGAGHLGSPCRGGVKTYCFGHEMFRDELTGDDGRAPYPVWDVVSGELVGALPEGW